MALLATTYRPMKLASNLIYLANGLHNVLWGRHNLALSHKEKWWLWIMFSYWPSLDNSLTYSLLSHASPGLSTNCIHLFPSIYPDISTQMTLPVCTFCIRLLILTLLLLMGQLLRESQTQTESKTHSTLLYKGWTHWTFTMLNLWTNPVRSDGFSSVDSPL